VRTLAALALLLAQDPRPFAKEARLAWAHYLAAGGTDHPRELAEMARAGLDAAVVHGDPAPVVTGLETLEKELKEGPRLAPLLDPELLKGLDLSKEADRERMAEHVRSRLRSVPARFRASVDGRPVVWLPPLPAGAKADPIPFELLTESLEEKPYWAAEASWRGVAAERTWAWGAAKDGPRELSVVSVGPGAPGARDREDGRWYERSWYVALRLEPRWVAVETWNGEGTEVRETKAWGRKYVDATFRHVRRFKLGDVTPLPKGPWTGKPKVLYSAVHTPHEQGLRPVSNDDGPFEFVQLRGFAALTSKDGGQGPRRHLSFDVDDSFAFFEKRSFAATVEFLDAGEGVFWIEYDSADRTLGPAERTARRAGEVRFGGTGEWRMETLDLPDALFGNRQKGGADFRLVTEKRGVSVRSVAVVPR
jgi:hypothetical protein